VPSPEVGEKVSEGLIGQLLEVLHAILGELVEGCQVASSNCTRRHCGTSRRSEESVARPYQARTLLSSRRSPVLTRRFRPREGTWLFQSAEMPYLNSRRSTEAASGSKSLSR
jgi:hypothetical protein